MNDPLMYDYFRALHKKFFREPGLNVLRQESDTLYDDLHSRLDRDGQKQLLKLIDTQVHLRDEVSLAGFIAGFRLACGIAAELEMERPYSFAEDEEANAIGTE